jgi:hypothetical protein
LNFLAAAEAAFVPTPVKKKPKANKPNVIKTSTGHSEGRTEDGAIPKRKVSA